MYLTPTYALSCNRLSGRVGEAIDLYLDLARVYKQFPHVHFKLGYLFLTLQDHANAVRHFSLEIEQYLAASKHDSSSASSQQDTTAAASSRKPSLSKSTGAQAKTFMFCACIGRSEAYSALRDDANAENDLLFVANRGGNTKRILVAMGVLFSHFGMHLRAEECFDKCAKLDADDPDYLIAHAELRLAQKRYASAAKMFAHCRTTCSASSATYHRALIGEGAALLRQSKLQEAVILLLQAMNTLRACIRNRRDGSDALASVSVGASGMNSAALDEPLGELYVLYHQATNLYGGLCLLKGELKAALDTYYSVLQSNKTATAATAERFTLPMLCVMPGTRNHQGDLVDSTKLSTKNLSEALRHLDELELRYGPDACLYFHRASVHKALGAFDAFVHDLALVESMDPDFVARYLQRDYFGDFLDLDTITWLPLPFIDAIHDSLERHEHAPPTSATLKAPLSPSRDRLALVKGKVSGGSETPSKSKKPAMRRQVPLVSETALYVYLQHRIECGAVLDEFAHVFQLDVFRRLPETRRPRHGTRLATQSLLSPWEGVVFDEKLTVETAASSDGGSTAAELHPVRERIKHVLTHFGRHPCVHMVAGMVELELFNASVAHIYFTEALSLITKQPDTVLSSASTTLSPLARRWHQRMLDRVRFYCLVWRSMASRIKIEMERAVEDLNLAAAIKLDDQGHRSASSSSDDPLLLAQRTLIMFLNGHLRSAMKLLRQLTRDLKRTKQRRRNAGVGRHLPMHYSEWLHIMDMFSNAGLNSFSLLPLQLEREASSRLASPPAAPSASAASGDAAKRSTSHDPDEHGSGDDGNDANDEERTAREEEETAAVIVKYALSKKTMTTSNGRTVLGTNVLQTETLDKFFESGLLKLATTGSVVETTPFFHAILSIDDNYLPPTNFASLELLKCKEVESMEEKLHACFLRLGKRSKWLQKKVGWKFEAFIDANLAHAYLPSDLDTLWHRARLLQDQRNYISAINDLSSCLELMAAHVTWEPSKKSQASGLRGKATFTNEAKRTQWLQLLLERGRLEMALEHYDRAIDDLTLVIAHVGKSNTVIEASAYDARSTSLIHLNRLGHAIQDLQHLVRLAQTKRSSSSTTSTESKDLETLLLYYVLIGNLYCQLALDQLKVSATVSHKHAALTPHILEQLKTMHLNAGFVAKADDAYEDALRIAPDHFLVYYFRGRLLALAAQPKRAAACLSDCLRLHPMFLPALFLRGSLYAQQSLTLLALADFYRVRHRAPTYPSLHTSIGFCHFDCGSMMKAVEALTEAVQQDPRDVDALYIRGCALQELFVLESAVKDFTRALAVDTEHFRALYQRAVCLVLYQRYTDALADLDRALALQSEWKEAWTLHAYASFCCSRYDDAVDSYGRAIGLRDAVSGVSESRGPTPAQRDSTLFLHRSLANLYAGHVRAALMDLDLALKRDNENYLACVAKAFVLVRMNEVEKAMQLLAHALPHYKKMRLMSPCDVFEAERVKAAAKEQQHRHGLSERSGSFVGGTFGAGAFTTSSASSSSAASPPKSSQATEPKPSQRISAAPDALFAFRKLAREEQEQRAQAYRQRRHLTNAAPETDGGAGATNARRTSALLSHSPRRKTLVGASLTASPDTAAVPTEQSTAATQRRERTAKFLRAIKKLTFEHRVLKALETATSAKFKKNEQMRRMLADLVRCKSSVPWPRGTLTTTILVWAFNALGQHHVHHRRVDDALMAFSLAIQAHPYNAVTFFNRGNVFLHMDVFASAVSGFQDAIDVDEQCFQAYNNMGVAQFRLQRLEDAHDAFATGLHHAEARTQRAVLLYNLGVVFQHLDKPDEAMEFYQQAIALDASRTEFFNNRSSILHQQLKFSVALEDYNRALALGDASRTDDRSQQDALVPAAGAATNGTRSCTEARLNRAQLFITMGRCTAAIKDLRVVLDALESARESETRSLGSSGSSASASTAAAEDHALAEELLAFCAKWQDAMQIAVKDFLFGLDSIPLFAALELYAFFGPALSQRKASSGAECEESSDTAMLCPLPLADPSFFDYERALGHLVALANVASANDDNQCDHDAEYEDDERDDAVRAAKQGLLAQPFSRYLLDAMAQCHAGAFDDAARSLLRAHYKTTLDSADEYVLLLWRVQVVLKTDSQQDERALGTGLPRALTLLQDFLTERQLPDEAPDVDADDCDLSVRRASGRKAPRDGALHDFDDDESHDELSTLDLHWRQQRRVIRADAYTLLGQLYQLNGQVHDARRTFAHALRIRDDHIVALLNFLQLSIVEAEYETALECIVRVLELVFVPRASDASASEAPGSHRSTLLSCDDVRGVLDARRSIETMLPAITALRADDDWRACGAQMLTLLREYKHLLSAHIQSNTAHIFRKQGALAHLVEEIRQVQQRKAAVAAAAAVSSGGSAPALLDLDEINRVLSEYTASILQSTTAGDGDAPALASGSNQDELQASLMSELSHVCDRVTQSLPPDARPTKQPKRPTPLDVEIDAPSTPSSPRSPPRASSKSPRSPSAPAGSRKTSLAMPVRRPTTTPLTTRTHRRSTTASASGNSALASSAAAMLSSTTPSQQQPMTRATTPKAVRSGDGSSPRQPLQPQRPQSGPHPLQTRHSRSQPRD